MTDQQELTRAAIYCRISLAVMNDTTKTDEQERLCRELCERRGWDVYEVYTDHSRSAWRRDRKRDGWDRMLADASEGRFRAIATYWGDRIVRQPRDLEDLLELREGTAGISLASVAGQYDFDNREHRMMMRWEVARACNESDAISDRKKAQYARWRREGRTRPGGAGGRAFAFERDGVTHRPDEADAVREAAAAIIAGGSVRSVLAALTERGIRSTAGNVMSQSSFTRMITLPRMAGLMPDGESKGAWEPVLERSTWEALRAATAPGASLSRGTGGGARHLLAGIMKCGACGHAMYSGYKGSSRYRCPQDGGCGKVSRDRQLLDAFVTGRVLARLASPANPEGKVPGVPGLAQRYAWLAAQKREIEEVLADPERGSVPALMKRLDGVNAKLAELREQSAGDAAARLRAAHAGIGAEEFAALPLSVQRSLVSACYEIAVLPASKMGPGFRAEDVRMTPRP